MATIDANTNWFYQNQDDLVSKYNGKFVAISDCSVLGAYDSFGGGVRAMIGKGYALGTFIIHHCLPEDAERKAYYFHSNRVDFGKALA